MCNTLRETPQKTERCWLTIQQITMHAWLTGVWVRLLPDGTEEQHQTHMDGYNMHNLLSCVRNHSVSHEDKTAWERKAGKHTFFCFEMNKKHLPHEKGTCFYFQKPWDFTQFHINNYWLFKIITTAWIMNHESSFVKNKGQNKWAYLNTTDIYGIIVKAILCSPTHSLNTQTHTHKEILILWFWMKCITPFWTISVLSWINAQQNNFQEPYSSAPIQSNPVQSSPVQSSPNLT
jgi:hypothetical protein